MNFAEELIERFTDFIYDEANTEKGRNFETNIIKAWNEGVEKVPENKREEIQIVIDGMKTFGMSGVAEKVKNQSPVENWDGVKLKTKGKEHINRKEQVKTDVKIGKHKISVKYGPSLLTSSGSNDVKAIFKALINRDDDYSEELKKLVKFTESKMMKSTLFSQSTKDTRKLSNRFKEKKLIEKHTEMHERLLKRFNSLFIYKDIGERITREILTGEMKFGGGDGTANTMIAYSIKHKKVLIKTIDDDFVRQTYMIAKPVVGFKSSSVKAGYNIWGVLRVGTETALKYSDEVIDEDTSISDFIEIIYDEGVLDYIKKFTNRVSSFFSDLKSRTSDFILNTMMTLFGIKIEASIKQNKIDFTDIQ